MMKIGILSYPLNNNYGCYLQTYALKTLLEGWGHQVTYIFRRHTIDTSLKYKAKFFVKNVFLSITQGIRLPLLFNAQVYENNYMLDKGRAFVPFFEKYFSPHSDPLYTTYELKKYCEGRFDAIIVGSDQVWRPDLLKCIEDYFLFFLNDSHVKRISYAASFGKSNPHFSEKSRRLCGIGFSKFKAVSVRETDGIDIINRMGWKSPQAVHVLDPTMLLDSQQYKKLLSNDEKITPTLFCYFLDFSEEKKKYIDEVAAELGLEVDNIIVGREKRNFIYPSVEDWLTRLKKCSFAITDSFHGTVFSIIFQIPFVVVLNEKRGNARLYSLLKKFGLDNRIVRDGNLHQLIQSEIDWEEANRRINEMKKFSLDFLKNALKT